jgi:RNA polymerase sigma factor (sigma-70 family)
MNQDNIWDKFRKGDKSAMESIYNTHVDQLFMYGLRFNQDRDLIMDLIQDLFIHLWTNREKLGDAPVVKAFLMRSLRNRMIDHFRKEKKNIDIDTVAIKGHDHSKEEELINFENSSALSNNLANAMKTLTDKQREIIHLRYTENLSYEDIGNLLNINYQSVRNLAHRAIVELRKTLTICIIILLRALEYILINQSY